MSRRKNVKLSQVFLKDKNIIDKIIGSLDIKKNEVWVEIGGGEGAITFPMLQKEAKLIVFEKDRLLSENLMKEAIKRSFHNRILLLGDFLKFSFQDFAKFYGLEKIRLVGNIPYHITGMILRRIIENHSKIYVAYLMMQKEVAKRLIAKPGTKEYGALTVLTRAFFNVNVLFDIKPGSFNPQPKVTSSFVKLSPYTENPYLDEYFSEFENIVKLAFSSRRKKLKNTLFSTLNLSMPEYENKRAEELEVEDYFKILGRVSGV